jgi:hypothetical protein
MTESMVRSDTPLFPSAQPHSSDARRGACRAGGGREAVVALTRMRVDLCTDHLSTCYGREVKLRSPEPATLVQCVL